MCYWRLASKLGSFYGTEKLGLCSIVSVSLHRDPRSEGCRSGRWCIHLHGWLTTEKPRSSHRLGNQRPRAFVELMVLQCSCLPTGKLETTQSSQIQKNSYIREEKDGKQGRKPFVSWGEGLVLLSRTLEKGKDILLYLDSGSGWALFIKFRVYKMGSREIVLGFRLAS